MDTNSGNCGESCSNSEKVGHLMTSPSANSENSPGCGDSEVDTITITVAPTTGGTFDISVQKNLAIENLKKVISKKLKVPKERILLLHKEKQLRVGSLSQNSICDGSTLTLLPSVETGLLSQRPEQTVMQALESLNDSQVNDFLSGKAPLNLTMRLGDHMMLIQLQLSSLSPNASRKKASADAASSSSTSSQVPNGPSTSSTPTPDTADISLPNLSLINSKLNSLLHKNSENLNALKRKLISDSDPGKKKIKSEQDCQDDVQPSTSNCSKTSDEGKDTGIAPEDCKRSEILSQIMESVRRISENTQEMTQAIEGKVCEGGGPPSCDTECTCGHRPAVVKKEASAGSSTSAGKTQGDAPPAAAGASLDTKALAEASRNLTQTLKQLSSEVLTCRPGCPQISNSCLSRRRPGTPGAIIESMQHHGKGVFSGTFSGTLNPALQDRYGRPKRDISTIIHILNDLLCATPHYRPRHSSSSKAAAAAAESAASKLLDVASVDDETHTAGENEATREKLERLRLVMEQNRARRRARREGKSPWASADAPTLMEGTEDMDGDMLEIPPPEAVLA